MGRKSKQPAKALPGRAACVAKERRIRSVARQQHVRTTGLKVKRDQACRRRRCPPRSPPDDETASDMFVSTDIDLRPRGPRRTGLPHAKDEVRPRRRGRLGDVHKVLPRDRLALFAHFQNTSRPNPNRSSRSPCRTGRSSSSSMRRILSMIREPFARTKLEIEPRRSDGLGLHPECFEKPEQILDGFKAGSLVRIPGRGPEKIPGFDRGRTADIRRPLRRTHADPSSGGRFRPASLPVRCRSRGTCPAVR